MKNLQKIYESGKTVFTVKDLQNILDYKNTQSVRNFANRLVKKNIFINPKKGIYCLKNFNIYEFATKIKKFSYISLETVLKSAGIIFQHYENTIFLVSDRSQQIKCCGYKFLYFKIKKDILLNPL
jgi:hypothetical protein